MTDTLQLHCDHLNRMRHTKERGWFWYVATRNDKREVMRAEGAEVEVVQRREMFGRE